ANRAPIRSALEAVVGQFNDPRFLRQGGPAAGRGGNTNADGGPGIDESLDITGGNPPLLKEVIVRECFENSTQILNTKTIEELVVESQCASDMQSEARRIGAMTRQNVVREMEGYLSIVKAIGGASGIRHVILLSDGFAIQKDVASFANVARAAAEAGVQFSVMLEEPDISLADPGRRVAGSSSSPTTYATDTGQATRRRNDDKML